MEFWLKFGGNFRPSVHPSEIWRNSVRPGLSTIGGAIHTDLRLYYNTAYFTADFGIKLTAKFAMDFTLDFTLNLMDFVDAKSFPSIGLFKKIHVFQKDKKVDR